MTNQRAAGMSDTRRASTPEGEERAAPRAAEWKVVQGRLLRRSRTLPHERAVSARRDADGHGILPRLDRSEAAPSRDAVSGRALQQSIGQSMSELGASAPVASAYYDKRAAEGDGCPSSPRRMLFPPEPAGAAGAGSPPGSPRPSPRPSLGSASVASSAASSAGSARAKPAASAAAAAMLASPAAAAAAAAYGAAFRSPSSRSEATQLAERC